MIKHTKNNNKLSDTINQNRAAASYRPYCLTKVFDISNIFTVHYFKYNKGFKFTGEKHDFWEIVYADVGSVSVIADSRALTLKQGEAVFHKPDEYHNVFTPDNVGYVVIVTFECLSPAMDFFCGKLLRFGDEEKSLIKRIVEEGANTFSDKLNDLYTEQMHRREKTPFGSEQIISTCLEQLLILLARSASVIENSGRVSAGLKSHYTDELVQKIIEILNSNVHGSVNLDSLSKTLYFSKTYLKTLFRQRTGESIIQHFLKLKIEEAKKMIAKNHYTFTRIAAELSLSSVQYFSRLFKAHTDMTPSDYARSVKAENLL